VWRHGPFVLNIRISFDVIWHNFNVISLEIGAASTSSVKLKVLIILISISVKQQGWHSWLMRGIRWETSRARFLVTSHPCFDFFLYSVAFAYSYALAERGGGGKVCNPESFKHEPPGNHSLLFEVKYVL